jgi:hypothetical protein
LKFYTQREKLKKKKVVEKIRNEKKVEKIFGGNKTKKEKHKAKKK